MQGYAERVSDEKASRCKSELAFHRTVPYVFSRHGDKRVSCISTN
jgi:hypothetical protein